MYCNEKVAHRESNKIPVKSDLEKLALSEFGELDAKRTKRTSSIRGMQTSNTSAFSPLEKPFFTAMAKGLK